MKERLVLALALGALLLGAMPVATSAAGTDMVAGTAAFSTIDDSRAWVNARSNADGSNPRGTYRIDVVSSGVRFEAEVTCLAVDGHDAVIGAVVTRSSDTAQVAVGTEILHFIRDAGSPGTDDSSTTFVDTTGTTCVDITVADVAPLQPVQSGNWVVRDR